MKSISTSISNSVTVPLTAPGRPTRSANRPSRAARLTASLAENLVRSRLARLQSSALVLTEGDRSTVYGAAESEERVTVRVHDPRFWSAVMSQGSLGAGEAYVCGWWTTDDLPGVVRLFVRDQEALQGMESGLARVSQPLLKAWHALRANTETGSRRNISAHYDLSNDFFRLFLDPSMTYSCAIFEDANSTLAEAQQSKIDRLCRKLDLAPGDHLLEIGTGWGALALHAASEYGCRVTTTTISKEQHALARQRIDAAGLTDRIDLRIQDYRRLEGRFDKLVSVEMIEAVGHRFFDTFFGTCSRLLAEDGLMMLQAITIADQHYERARRSVDFIQRHVFPGSCIPSVTALLDSTTRSTDLRLVHLEDIGPHYERTLFEWRQTLLAERDRVHALGLDEEFVRLWEFYLAYCEGGYAERHLGNAQMLLAKPRARNVPLLPPLPAASR